MKRNLYKYRKVKKEVAERDNYTCVLCGRYPAADAHHVIFRSKQGEDCKENIVCLCRNCHDKAHGIHAKVIQTELISYLKGIYGDEYSSFKRKIN